MTRGCSAAAAFMLLGAGRVVAEPAEVEALHGFPGFSEIGTMRSLSKSLAAKPPAAAKIAELQARLLYDEYTRLLSASEATERRLEEQQQAVRDAERRVELLERQRAACMSSLPCLLGGAAEIGSKVAVATNELDTARALLRGLEAERQARAAQLAVADASVHRTLKAEIENEQDRLKAEAVTLSAVPPLEGIPVEPGFVMLRLKPGTTKVAIESLLAKHDLRPVGALAEAGILFAENPPPPDETPAQSVARTQALLQALKAEEIVLAAAPNTPLQGNIVPPRTDITTAVPGLPARWGWTDLEMRDGDGNWGQKMARFPGAWNFSDVIRRRNYAAPGIGVVDVGFLPSHQDLAVTVAPFSPDRPLNHGNHVAGIIGAVFHNGHGVNGCTPFGRVVVCGIARLSSLAEGGAGSQPTLDSIPDMTLLMAEIIATMTRLIADKELNLKVINLSVGYNWVSHYKRNPNTDAAIQEIVRSHGVIMGGIAEFASRNGIVLVAAAGNDSKPAAGMPDMEAQWASPFNWAALNPGNTGSVADNIIVVESVNRRGERSSFSSVQGSSNLGTVVAAPGEDILSTGAVSVDSYLLDSGTSMAAPHVSALVALMHAYRKDLEPASVVRIIRETARPSVTPGGAPIIDAFAAMLATDEGALGDLADLDADERVGRKDLELFRKWMAAAGTVPSVDLNGDAEILEAENVYPRADLNGDGKLSPDARAPVRGRALTDLEVLLLAWNDDPLSRDELPEMFPARPSILVEGFSVASSPAPELSLADAATMSALGPSWAAIPSRSPCAPAINVVPSGTSMLTVGEAWEKAYELETLTGSRVEPEFAVVVFDEIDDDVLAAATDIGAVRTCDRDATAKADPAWSLTGAWGVDAQGAWALMGYPAERKRLPGSGVVIGHPDTGYTQHPEIWGSAGSTLKPERGWNFFEADPYPTDRMTGKNPGHGTKTASVIVSPPGRQPGTTSVEGVTGVAPGASVIPYRVTDRVALFRTRPLADAICRAANETDPPVDVISISLGGVPSPRVHEAIRYAVDRGIVVLAAAGNGARMVVWPARYDEVVAVAASNSEGGTWKGSCRGSEVDITAPGQAVWGAVSKKEGKDCLCAWPGCGTSYAVANAAGVAALWLDHHREALAPIRRTAAVPRAFAQVLHDHGYRTPPVWEPKKYGPGILDARRALEAPFSVAPGAAPAPPPDPCGDGKGGEREAVLSILERSGTAGGLAKLGHLLHEEPGCDVVARLGDEIAFHVATSEKAQDALDALDTAAEPAEESYTAARLALGELDLSPSLRARLSAP